MSEGKKPALQVINSPKVVEPRNYWNTVGQNKEFFPTEPRLESIPVLNKQGRVLQEPKDDWWINSKDHNYCFWSYIREHSQPDGTMEPLLQSDIAKLFGCSSTKVHFMLKEAMDRLLTDENMQILQNMLELTIEDPGEETLQHEVPSDLDETEIDSED